MSDPESAATAAHFIAKVARKPGTREEVAAFSRAGRACPDVMNKAVTSVDRDRARHAKDEGRIASIESRWREERAKSVKQEAKIMRLERRVDELQKDNGEVRASYRAAQADKERREREVATAVVRAKAAETAKEQADRARAKQVQDLKNEIRNNKLKYEVAQTTYRADRKLKEAEITTLREKLQKAENAANASDEVYNKKVGALKDRVTVLETELDAKNRKAAEDEAATTALRLRLVKAQLKARAADSREKELRRANDKISRYEMHCRRMTESYGSKIILDAYNKSAASGGPLATSGGPAAEGAGARSQVGPASRRRPTATGSMEEIVRSAIRAATAGVGEQAGTSSGRQAASAGLLPHTMRAVIAAEQAQDSEDEITVIAVKRPLAGVAGRRKSASSKRPSEASGTTVAFEDLTTEPDSN